VTGDRPSEVPPVSLLHSLYTFFITRPSGGYLLLVVNVIILAGSMAVTLLVRKGIYQDVPWGASVVASFLIGFTLLVFFNSLVYIGSLAEAPSEQRQR
jgi:hypothetical protein